MKRLSLIPVLLSCAIAVSAQPAQDQLLKEIARLKQVAAALPENDDVKALRPVLVGALDRSEASLEAGRTLHALDLLTQVRPRLMALEFRDGNRRFAQADLKQFEQDWRAADEELRAGESRYRQMSWDNTQPAVRAMAEAMWSQVRVLYDAAQAYAQVTSPAAGYFYLGEARASLDWALFLRQLRFETSEPAPVLRSIAPEIAELERRIGAAYQPPLSIDKHPQFIRLNATVKQAVELDQAGLHAGALYMYLRALRFFGQIVSETPDAAELAALKQQLAAAQKRVAHHPIARIFTEGAESSLASTDAEELKMARAAVEQVVPGYFAAREKPVTASAAEVGKTVKVTLVRWPYT